MLQNVVNKIQDSVKKKLKEFVVKPQIDGLYTYFDIIGEEKIVMENDITDNFVESNVAYQDHIALKPSMFSISGEVGELVYYRKDPRQSDVGYVASKLDDIGSFLPPMGRAFNKAKHIAMKASGVIQTVDDILGRLNDPFTEETRQQTAFIVLSACRELRVPIDISTPWGEMSSFVIQKLEMEQPKTTKDKSIIRITFKEFRKVDMSVVRFDKEKYQSRAGYQEAPVVEQGQTTGRQGLTSTAYKVFGEK